MRICIIRNNNPGHVQIADMLWRSALRLGHTPVLAGANDMSPRPADMTILVNIVPKAMAAVNKATGTLGRIRNKVYINLENLPFAEGSGQFERYRIKEFNAQIEIFNPGCVTLCDPGVYDRVSLKKLGVMMPRQFYDKGFLYDPDFHRDLRMLKDLGACFIGSLSEDRKEKLASIRKVNVFRSWGYEKVSLMNRHAISLNFQKRDEHNFKTYRAVDAIMCGCLFLTEQDDFHTTFPDDCYVSVPIEDMPEAVEYYLEHSNEREKIVGLAQEFIKSNFGVDQYLSGLVEEFQDA
jgi:hypothetical protein